MLLELLVNVDVVEELISEAVVFVMHLLVTVSRHISRGLPLFANLIESGECRADVFLFLDDAA